MEPIVIYNYFEQKPYNLQPGCDVVMEICDLRYITIFIPGSDKLIKYDLNALNYNSYSDPFFSCANIIDRLIFSKELNLKYYDKDGQLQDYPAVLTKAILTPSNNNGEEFGSVDEEMEEIIVVE